MSMQPQGGTPQVRQSRVSPSIVWQDECIAGHKCAGHEKRLNEEVCARHAGHKHAAGHVDTRCAADTITQ